MCVPFSDSATSSNTAQRDGPVRLIRIGKDEPAHSAMRGVRVMTSPNYVSRTFSRINIVSIVRPKPSTLSATAFTAWL
jgi:hypothetical protein